jgi:competence protein CoiA
MRYALVDHVRKEASPGARGICEGCGVAMVAKCGPHVVHHWAHARRQSCDPWWENKTQWHIDWQNLFPKECQEVWHIAPDGERHCADIKTRTGIVVEVQHSAMTDVERESREAFYGNLVWIVDGRRFRENFDVYHRLPDPNSEIARDLAWQKATREMKGAASGIFWRKSENPPIDGVEPSMVLLHSINQIGEAVDAAYIGHHQYDWIRPHKTWLAAKCPVYIDFGDDWLLRLETYDRRGLPCVRYIAKRKFLHDVMVETSTSEIAARFYPI